MSGIDREFPSATGLVRAYLVTLVFRFRHMTEGAPDAFGDFEAGSGVRTPSAIVLHMTALLNVVREAFEPGASVHLDPLPFPAACERFLEAARALDRVVADDAPLPGDRTFGQLWRGPLADAMTHVGQLATLRRLADAPIERVRYPYVDMPDLNG